MTERDPDVDQHNDTEAEPVPDVRNDYVGEGNRGETADEEPAGPVTDSGPTRDAPPAQPIDTTSESRPPQVAEPQGG